MINTLIIFTSNGKKNDVHERKCITKRHRVKSGFLADTFPMNNSILSAETFARNDSLYVFRNFAKTKYENGILPYFYNIV